MDKHFSQAIGKMFGTRVKSLLYYGSNAFEERTKSKLSDYDFSLVLDKRNSVDLENISQITCKFNGIDLTVHYLEDIEAMGWNRFQHGNHGTFFLLHLASARVLLGSNIFARKISVIRDADIRESLRRQIIEYFWRLDHWYLAGHDENYLLNKFRKYLVRIAQDILVSEGDISFDEINKLGHKKFVKEYIADKDYLSEDTKLGLAKVVNSRNISGSSLLKLKELLYGDFRELFISK